MGQSDSREVRKIRKQVQRTESQSISKPNFSDFLALLGISTLSLMQDSQIVENPPFVCDGRQQCHFFGCEKKIITICGLGFFGPIESDGFYDVKVQIIKTRGIFGTIYDSGILKKRIFAEKGKKFYFIFDTPINLKSGSVRNCNKSYRIEYCLKGLNTSKWDRSTKPPCILQKGDTKFRLDWFSDQLAEILFKLG